MIDLQWPGNPPPTFKAPKIGIWKGGSTPLQATIRAELIALPNAPNMQEDVWYRICLPVDPCRNGKLPSDGRFTWRIVALPPTMDTCTAWNTLITAVDGIYLVTDYHSSPSELVYFDNFCFRCDLSYPDICRRVFSAERYLDSSCCTFGWYFQPNSELPLQELTYFIDGGQVDTLYAIGGCAYTTTPSNVHGSISGKFIFNPPCTQPFQLQGEINPTTASGKVKVIICARILLPSGGNEASTCCDTFELKCPRAPITKCDSLHVAPFIWSGLNLSGRTFTIFNQKQPSSPIKGVFIQLVPDPFPNDPNSKWNGGGLQVDGGSRSWGVANSGTPYYSRIAMHCPGETSAPQGPAANTTVKFNLGVDYTLNWKGTVLLTVVHCDGDTCRLSYEWCALTNWRLCGRRFPWLPVISPVAIRERLVGGRVGVQDSSGVIGSIAVRLDSAMLRRVRLVSCGASGVRDGDVVAGEVRQLHDAAALILLPDLPEPEERAPISYTLTPIFECERCDAVDYHIELYDREGNPIETSRQRASTQVTSVESQGTEGSRSQGELLIVPNPSEETATLRFATSLPGPVALEVVDALGKVVLQWSDYLETAGMQSIGMSTRQLPSGYYHLRLRLPDQRVLTAALTVVR